MTAAEADQATTPTAADGHRLLDRLIADGLPTPTHRAVDADPRRSGDTLLLHVELADEAAFRAWATVLDSCGEVEAATRARPVRVGPVSYVAATGRLRGVQAAIVLAVDHAEDRDPATYAAPEPRAVALTDRGAAAQDASASRLALAKGRVREQLAELYPEPPDPRPTGPADTPAPDPSVVLPSRSVPGSGVADDARTVAMDRADLCGARARLREAQDVWEGDRPVVGGVLVTDAGVLDERAETWVGGERP